jgi:hypothetical protein
MRNNGYPCVMPNYGVPNEKRYPPTAAASSRPRGMAPRDSSAPNATYVPSPGFAGDDEFQYEAYARGGGGMPVRLLVTVKVRVQPPR